MKIRIVPCLDLDIIRDLDRACFGKKYRMGIEEVTKSTWWIALVDDGVAAFGGACVWRDGTLYFTRAGVLEKFRGLGLQRLLITQRKKYGKKLGAPSAVTYTSTFNCYSVNNLISAGFRLYNPKRAWEGRGFLYWRCAL